MIIGAFDATTVRQTQGIFWVQVVGNAATREKICVIAFHSIVIIRLGGNQITVGNGLFYP